MLEGEVDPIIAKLPEYFEIVGLFFCVLQELLFDELRGTFSFSDEGELIIRTVFLWIPLVLALTVRTSANIVLL